MNFIKNVESGCAWGCAWGQLFQAGTDLEPAELLLLRTAGELYRGLFCLSEATVSNSPRPAVA